MDDRQKTSESRQDSVIEARERWVSPSQLSTHRLCPRKWFYQKILKIPEPQSPGAAAGEHAHKQLESYLLGLPYENLPHVEALLPFLPKPNTPGYRPEIRIEIPSFAPGALLVVRIDLVNESETYCDGLGVWRESKDIPEIIDFKFMIPRFWLTATQLREDLQLNTYACALYPDREFVRISHLYAERPPADAASGWRGDRQKVTVVRTRAELRAWRDRTADPEIRALLVTAGLLDVSETAVRAPDACKAYGGCHYGPSLRPGDGKLDICTRRLSGPELEVDLFKSLQMKRDAAVAAAQNNENDEKEKKDMGLFESLKQKKAAGPNGAAPPPPPAAATAAPAAAVTTQPATPPAPPAPPAAAPVVDEPDPPKSAATLALEAEMKKSLAEAEEAERAEAAKAAPAAASATLPPATATAPAETTATETPKGKRGRSAKAAEGVATSASEVPAVDGVLRLYIDCIPAHPSRSLDAYVAGLCSKLCEEYNVPDVRCGDGQNHPLAFGKWKGALAARVRATPPSPGDWWIVTRGNEINDVVASALAQLPNASCTRGL